MSRKVILTEMYFEKHSSWVGENLEEEGLYTDMPSQQQGSCRVKRKKNGLRAVRRTGIVNGASETGRIA